MIILNSCSVNLVKNGINKLIFSSYLMICLHLICAPTIARKKYGKICAVNYSTSLSILTENPK